MRLSFTFSTLDEIENLVNALIGAHPTGLTLSVDTIEKGTPEQQRPPYPKTEDELTLHDLALYGAGQLDAYYAFVKANRISLEFVSDAVQIGIDQLRSTRHAWSGGNIIAQRDAYVEMAIAQAKQEMEEDNAK